VRELLEVAAAPVLAAMPDREPVDRLYNPEVTDEDIRAHGPVSDDPADLVAEVERHAEWAAWLAETPFGEQGELNEVGFQVVSLILRGSVRAALCGVFEDDPETAEIRAYADGESAFVMSELPGRTAIEMSDFARLPEMLVEHVPEVPAGRCRQVWLSVDEDGLVREGQEESVELLCDVLDRPRSGTALLDMLAFGGLCSEFPDHGFVLLDTDAGRHALAAITRGGGRRDLVLTPFSRAMLVDWFRRMFDIEDGGSDIGDEIGNEEVS
jgi:hypothetical protein